MAGRSVTVTLGANVSGFIAGMKSAAASVDSVVGKMADSATKNRAEWDTVGTTLTRVGAVAAAGLGLAAKAAIDWESAFAGVKKTVDGTPEQIAALEGELRGMARTMATSHQDIAAVAEAAGQLGVKTEDVAGFTRTMVMLGETTNLTATEAAESLAQFMNVMGTAPDQVDNLGSALVALGNNGASTERDIVQMSQRIAGAGKQIGLTEAEVMGFASAMASVGIEVEAGGTAISSTMLKMEQAVRAGGKELDLLAQTAGMSGAEFKQAFETDAAGAMQAFIEGLGRVQQAGGDVTGILRELGITGIREADALRRLASSGDLLAESMETAKSAMAGGNALMDEYAKRAATTESQVKIAWNNIKDAAITAGQLMLPAIAGAAQALVGLAQAFGDLPAGAQAAMVGVAALVAAVGLIGGGVIKAIVAFAELRAALTALGAASAVPALASIGTRIMSIATYAVPAALALAAVGVAIQALKPGPAVASLEQMSAKMRTVATDAGAAKTALDSMFKNVNGDELVGGVDSLATAIQRFANPSVAEQIANIGEKIATLGMADSQMERVNAQFQLMDQSLAQLAKGGNLSEAQAAFAQIRTEWERQGQGLDTLMPKFASYKASLEDTAAQMGVTGLSMQDYADWMGGKIPAAVQAAAASSQEAAGALKAVGDAAGRAAMSVKDYANAMLALSGSQIGVESAIAAANDALKENGKNIDITTEAGRANVGALNQLAAASMQYVQTLADQGAGQEEQAAAISRARGEFERLAQAMGYTEPAIRKMADAFFATVAPNQQAAAAARQFAVDAASGSKAAGEMAAALTGMPKNTQISITAPDMAPMTVTAENLKRALETIPADKVITVTMPNGQVVTGTAAEIQAGLERIQPEKRINVTTPGAEQANANIQTLTGMLTGLPEYKNVVVTLPNGEQAYTTAQRLGEAIRGVPDDKTVTITLSNGETVTMTAGQVRDAINGIPGSKTTTLNADAAGALAGAAAAQAAVNAVVGKTVPVNANAAGAQAGAAAAQAAVNAVIGKTVPVNANPAGAQSGASQAQGAVNSVQGKTVAINASAAGAQAGAAAARAAIASVQGKTVTITVRTVAVGGTGGGITVADGGMIPAVSGLAGTAAHAGAQRLSVGGRVRGVSSHPRADNIPAWVTAGEVMMSNAAGDDYGRARLLALNSRRVDPSAFAAFMSAQGFADGGEIGKAKESFSRPAPVSSILTTAGAQTATAPGRVINQEFNYYYPVGERESSATRRSAVDAGMAAML